MTATSPYAEHLATDRRLIILRVLAEQPEYSLSDSAMRSALDCLAHAISREQMKKDIDWLKAERLISFENIGKGIIVMKATGKGVDVAQGRARVKGVKKPEPEL